MDDSLDSEIARVRAEIQNLTKKRKLLTSSLLSSTKIQSRLSKYQAAPEAETATPLNVAQIQEHSQTNTHRLAFGVTSFPFVDPSPELQSRNPLLGIRFDICNRHGKFDSPYYIFCARVHPKDKALRIHRHTIPALVPLERYEREYLPLSSSPREDDEGYGGSDDSRLGEGEGKKQNLHTLVARVRHDLTNWRMRQETVDWLREELGLAITDGGRKSSGEDTSNKQGPDEEEVDSDVDMSERSFPGEQESPGRFDIESLDSAQTDARQLRIIWSDGRLARLKISDDGRVDKAVVLGDGNRRLGDVERILRGKETDGASLTDLLGRLELVYNRGLRLEAAAGDR